MPLSYLMQLLAQEYFIEFSRQESVRLYKGSYTIQALYEVYCTVDILKVTILEHNAIITKGFNFLVN